MTGADKTVHAALRDMEPVMLEKLAEGGTVSFSPKGVSMLPMLRAAGDTVTLKKPPERLKRGTVALFTLTDGEEKKYILHRCVRRKKGLYVFCGDNRVTCDPPVPYDNILGVVVDYIRRGKKHSLSEPAYRLYTAWMVATPRVRRVSIKLEWFLIRLWRRMRSKSRRTPRAR